MSGLQDMNFVGRVALVTGAGNGLGRIYALQFAERGAAVVVNDLGVDNKGVGSSTKAADVVVNEIRSKGGKAVANYDSVEFGDRLVDTAIKSFGRIDIVVNNAGILRDKSFIRMSDDEWDIIHKVHLKGAFKVTRAAWPYMREQKYGRIIMVSSPSGLYGNFGQANYSAAKMGLVGLSNTLAKEGAKYNIKCNAIAPTAGSRLLQTVMPPDMVEALKPEYISPLVLYLCHDSSENSGGVYELNAGWIGKIRMETTQGFLVAKKDEKTGGYEMTPESVRDNWDQITDFTGSEEANSEVQQNRLMAALQALQNNEEYPKRPAPSTKTTGSSTGWTYTDRDVMLYALSIGCSTTQPDHLKFLFELSDDFSVFPSFAVLVGYNGGDLDLNEENTGISIDPTKILHGEQYLELYKPLPTSATLTTKTEVADVLDKKSGAIILLNMTSYDESGEKVCFNQTSVFVVGAGGFGGKRSSDKTIPTVNAPNRQPDSSVEEKTSVDQAALYRLDGDRNPLHIDPSFAAMGGHDKPILHGLCTLGYSTRHVMMEYADNDVTKFKSMKVRFANPVLPGQTIRTNMWRDGNRVIFETVVPETGNKVITGAYVDLLSVVESANQSSTSPSEKLFSELQKRITPEVVKKTSAVFRFNVSMPDGTIRSWLVDLKNAAGSITSLQENANVKQDVALSLSEDDLIKMATGKLDAQKAFMSGKLKLKGNVMVTQKLQALFAAGSKL